MTKYVSTKKKYESLLWEQNLHKKEESISQKDGISVVIGDEEIKEGQDEDGYVYADVVSESESDDIKEEYPTIPLDESEDSYENPVYLPPPYDDGMFFATDATMFKNSKTLYCIQNRSGDEGLLIIDPDPRMKRRALQSPDTFLKWACEFENSLKVEYNDIEVLEPGVVKLMGDSWEVKDKVKIQFK